MTFQNTYSSHKNNFLAPIFPLRPTSFAVFSGGLQAVQSFSKAALDGDTHTLRILGPTAFYWQTNSASLGGFHCIKQRKDRKTQMQNIFCNWNAKVIYNLSSWDSWKTLEISRKRFCSTEKICVNETHPHFLVQLIKAKKNKKLFASEICIN